MNSLITVDWLHQQLHNPEIIILNASMREKSKVCIPGARIFDIKKEFSDLNSEFPNTIPSPEEFELKCQKIGIQQNHTLVVYDNEGVYSSPRAWWLFKVMGFDNVVLLDGGLVAWLEKKYPTKPIRVETYNKGDFKAAFRKEWFRDYTAIQENIDSKQELVLDARAEGRFNGTVPEPREGLPSGSIPNSVNIPFTKVVNGPYFKTKTELESVYAAIDPKKPLIFSCGSGITACIILFGFYLLHPQAQLAIYDGSWTEWAMRNSEL